MTPKFLDGLLEFFDAGVQNISDSETVRRFVGTRKTVDGTISVSPVSWLHKY